MCGITIFFLIIYLKGLFEWFILKTKGLFGGDSSSTNQGRQKFNNANPGSQKPGGPQKPEGPINMGSSNKNKDESESSRPIKNMRKSKSNAELGRRIVDKNGNERMNKTVHVIKRKGAQALDYTDDSALLQVPNLSRKRSHQDFYSG